jgi:hypothetical protein
VNPWPRIREWLAKEEPLSWQEIFLCIVVGLAAIALIFAFKVATK